MGRDLVSDGWADQLVPRREGGGLQLLPRRSADWLWQERAVPAGRGSSGGAGSEARARRGGSGAGGGGAAGAARGPAASLHLGRVPNESSL